MPFGAGRKIQQSPTATPTRTYTAFTHRDDQEISLSAIATAEAFGTAVVTGPRPTFGGKTRLSVGAYSIPRNSAFSERGVDILLAGIASLEAVGAHFVLGGTIQILPTSIASAEAFGTSALSLESTIIGTGIASAETFGDPNVAPSGTVVCNSIDDGQKLVAWDPNSEPDLAGYRVHVGVISITYNTTYDVGLTTTPSTPEYVIANLTSGTTYYVAVTAYDTSNNESAFSAEVSFVATAGIRFGTFNVIGNRVINPTSIASAQAFGTLTTIPGPVDVFPTAITSNETFGAHFVLAGELAIGGIGIPSAEAFGDATLAFGAITVDLDGSAIASQEAFGAHVLDFTALIDNVGAIGSLEALGVPLVTAGEVFVRLIGAESSEAFGTAQLDQDMTLTGLASAEAIGDLALNIDIFPPSLVSAEAFGVLDVLRGNVDIFPPTIASLEGFGTAILIPADIQLPVRVFTARARTFTFPSAQ